MKRIDWEELIGQGTDAVRSHRVTVAKDLGRMALAVAGIAVIGSAMAAACPSCVDNVAAANAGTARGFGASIIGLLSLPMLLVGGIALAVVRSQRSPEHDSRTGSGTRSGTRSTVAALLLSAFVAAGCGGGGDQAGGEADANRVPADMSTAVEVSGVVEFKGTAPEPERIDVSADEYCGLHHDGGVVYTNEVIVNDGKLANVFVYVSNGLEGYSFEVPTTPAVLDQKGCRYHPHVQGVMVGQELQIRNSDSTLHNVHSMSKNNKQFNLGQYGGTVDTRVFESEEVMMPVVCDVHGWMKSWIAVLHHPAFGVTAEDGTFSFRVPPGEYTVTAWHERYGTKTAQLTVAEGTPATLNFTFE